MKQPKSHQAHGAPSQSRDELLRRVDASLRLVPHAAGRALIIRDGLPTDGVQSADAMWTYVEAEGFDVEVVRDGVMALSRARVVHVDVVVTALTHVRGSGLDLAEALVEAAPNTQVLVLAMAPPPAEVRRRLAGLHNVRLLAMSAAREDLMLVVRQAFESAVGFRGSLFGVSLVDLVQMCHLARRTLSLELVGPVRAGLHFVRGELVHAEAGPLRGESALPLIFAWSSGRMNMAVLSSTERSIERPFQITLLDALATLDETRARDVTAQLREADDGNGGGDAEIDRALERVMAGEAGTAPTGSR